MKLANSGLLIETVLPAKEGDAKIDLNLKIWPLQKLLCSAPFILIAQFTNNISVAHFKIRNDSKMLDTHHTALFVENMLAKEGFRFCPRKANVVWVVPCKDVWKQEWNIADICSEDEENVINAKTLLECEKINCIGYEALQLK